MLYSLAKGSWLFALRLKIKNPGRQLAGVIGREQIFYKYLLVGG